MPANFRSYEGQLRLLTAVIAAHPDLRLNYKDIAQHYGSDWGESGIEHFFRPIKKNSKAIQGLVKRGEDPVHFNHNAFQFRGIKKDAENLRQGKASSAAPSTPGGDRNTPKTPRTTGGGRKRAAPSTSKSTSNKKPKLATKSGSIYADGDGDDDDSENEHPPLNMTPTKSLVNEDRLRAYEHMMAAESASQIAPPDLVAPAQAVSPEEDDDDVKIVTPADVAHSFEPAQSFSAVAGYHSNAYYSNAYSVDADKSYEDEAYDEC